MLFKLETVRQSMRANRFLRRNSAIPCWGAYRKVLQ